MIIKCDQCDTKFKLDDAKVSEKGTKVRCSKCKHIFIVQKETTPEDFNALLNGLGTVSAETGRPPQMEMAPPATQDEKSLFAGESATVREEGGTVNAEKSLELAGQGEMGEDFFAAKEDTLPAEETGLDFGELSRTEEQVAPASAAVPEKELFDFGEFPFEETATAVPASFPSVVEADSAKSDEFDFGEISFSKGEGIPRATPESVRAEPQGLDFEITGASHGKDPAAQEKGRSADELSGDFFAFGEEPVSNGTSANTQGTAAESADTTGEGFDFGSLSVTAQGDGRPEIAGAIPAVPEPPVPFSFPYAEEELPPLSIATRKKGSSAFPMVVTVIAVLIVLAIAGSGYYIFREGPAAFNKLGLGSLAKWAGLKIAEDGGITVKNPVGAFMTNQEAGEIFVVTGEAVNNFREPRAAIQVRATIMGPKGETLRQKTAYCGNALSNEQLATLPMAKIEGTMANQFGDSLANLGVQPGKGIPFVIVFSGVPKEAAEFGVEIVGSTVASQ